MKKERIYITDITWHARDRRATLNFSKAIEKGRIYSPFVKSVSKSSTSEADTGKFQTIIQLPPDLEARIDRGEVELMVPEGGIPIFAGKDLIEKMVQQQGHARRELIHRGRTWHAGDER